MWVPSHTLYCNFTNKSMTNIILSLLFLCNYGNGKYKVPVHCLHIILCTGIIGLIIFLKPELEPRLCSDLLMLQAQLNPDSSPVGGLCLAGLRWALGLPSTSLFLIISNGHILCLRFFKIFAALLPSFFHPGRPLLSHLLLSYMAAVFIQDLPPDFGLPEFDSIAAENPALDQDEYDGVPRTR